MLIDSSGRKIEYIRISLTQRCNLNCIYCMTSDRQIVRDEPPENFVRIVKIASSLGISHIKLTGGEPLLYNNIENLIYEIKNISGIETVTLTTNGVNLNEKIDVLLKSGLDGINVSIDSGSRYLYKTITGSDCFDKVFDSVYNAAKKTEVKVNCVPIYNIENVISVAKIAKTLPISVRFIELMPFGPAAKMQGFTENELTKILNSRFGRLIPSSKSHGFGPARYFHIKGFKGDIGFISAISHRFCKDCNRIRITSDLKLKTCIQYPPVLDIKQLLSGNDGLIAEKIKECIQNKPWHHTFEEYDEICPMFKIGG